MRRGAEVVGRSNAKSFKFKREAAQRFPLTSETVNERLFAVALFGVQAAFDLHRRLGAREKRPGAWGRRVIERALNDDEGGIATRGERCRRVMHAERARIVIGMTAFEWMGEDDFRPVQCDQVRDARGQEREFIAGFLVRYIEALVGGSRNARNRKHVAQFLHPRGAVFTP